MITRIEIDGFKSFENFSLNLRPFSAIVGPNASGKSNLFDALKFLSLLAQTDVHSAMQSMRGEPEELFRITTVREHTRMKFAVEVLLPRFGFDPFGARFEINAQRLRYELALTMRFDAQRVPTGIVVEEESCRHIAKKDDYIGFINKSLVSYSSRRNPFMEMSREGKVPVIQIRQDGPTETGASKRGRPLKLAAGEATRTALSTINTAEFPHLFALREVLSEISFLEINPSEARKPNDRFEEKKLRADASNLASVLAHIKDETGTLDRPEGAIADISVDLSSLISTVKRVKVHSGSNVREYSFSIETEDGLEFSSRLISDGTLRLLALLTILDDPFRSGILCFEEPDNGVHEGRINDLINILRESTLEYEMGESPFQIIINTHSPAVLTSLLPKEIIAADLVSSSNPKDGRSVHRTRMRIGVEEDSLDLEPGSMLTRAEIGRILKKKQGQA
ncbi:AAA family ATPase [Alteriqipengyuania sp.]|uniref:AAA family ATPase n=1 Tax=Alteriqipengyuania sp. TaxID=2800692 RepID=UPI003513A52A